jgi:D-3-phosphoglycerate dehydrogenase
VLAHIFSCLSEAGINVEQTENVVFDGAEAACVRIQVDRRPEEVVLDGIRLGNADVYSVSLSPL